MKCHSGKIVCANLTLLIDQEEYQFIWLEELSRLLKKGGICILSIHGEYCHKQLDKNCYDLLMKNGFVYKKMPINVFNTRAFSGFYQNSYHLKSYIYENWSRYFRIVEYKIQGINNHQDAVVLQKK